MTIFATDTDTVLLHCRQGTKASWPFAPGTKLKSHNAETSTSNIMLVVWLVSTYITRSYTPSCYSLSIVVSPKHSRASACRVE